MPLTDNIKGSDIKSSQGIVIKSVPLATLTRAFNIQNITVKSATKNPYEGKVDQTTVKDTPIATSALGTPVYSNITFDSVQYTNMQTKQVFRTKQLVYETVLITVNQAKTIVKTNIAGGDGTVKEYISLDDYQVQVNGIITGGNGHYPVEDVLALKQMLDAPVNIPVICEYLNRLGIQELIVTDYSLPQVPGGYSQQNFTINLLSDIPIILQLK